jgi:hypothetical protein
MSNEPKEQELGEWRTNPFLDPQVRAKISELEHDFKMQVIHNDETRKALEWIKEAYPSIIEQYEAVMAIEAAEYEAKHKFFGEIK